MTKIIDLFAGPGGWDEGLKMLGRHHGCLGIEWDKAACETARAARHARLQADIAALDPREFGPVEGLIASPPCQSFSTAGKQKGRADREHVIACAHEIAAGFDSRWQYGGLLADERSLLTVEPLRWALALRPRWIAFEQVPAVLELWSIFAQILGVEGYSTDVGLLTAEQYGVPQTRKRAYLIASLDGEVRLPAPTHQKYRKGEPAQHKDGLLPWVSMAKALGWTEGLVVNTRGERRTSGGNEFSADRPSHGLTGRARSWAVRFGNQPNSAVRTVDEPAATLRFSGRMNACDWVFDRPAPTIVCTRRSRDGLLVGRQLPPGEGVNVGGKNWVPTHLNPRQVTAAPRAITDPAPTLTSALGKGVQVWDEGDGTSRDGRAMSRNAIRVSVEEASVLMGFRPDYPWQGSRTKQFEQVGNAVCPPMGKVVLAAAMGAA